MMLIYERKSAEQERDFQVAMLDEKVIWIIAAINGNEIERY